MGSSIQLKYTFQPPLRIRKNPSPPRMINRLRKINPKETRLRLNEYL